MVTLLTMSVGTTVLQSNIVSYNTGQIVEAGGCHPEFKSPHITVGSLNINPRGVDPVINMLDVTDQYQSGHMPLSLGRQSTFQ